MPRQHPHKRALCEAAERSGLTNSGYEASALLAAAAGEPRPDDRQAERLMAELMATRAQLRYGNNLNQIARVLNAGGEAPEWVSGASRLTAPSSTASTQQSATSRRRLAPADRSPDFPS